MLHGVVSSAAPLVFLVLMVNQKALATCVKWVTTVWRAAYGVCV